MKGFMRVMQSWRQALDLVKPATLWSLLQVTAKTIVTVFRLALPLFLLPLVLLYIILPKTLAAVVIFAIVATIYWFFLVTVAARPSLELKTIWYVESNALALLPITVGVLLMVLLPGAPFWAPGFFFFLFFFYDTPLTWKGILRLPIDTARLCFSLLPLYCVLVLLWYLLALPINSASSLWIVSCWFFIVIPLYLVFISRLYTIVIHQNYKEYYDND